MSRLNIALICILVLLLLFTKVDSADSPAEKKSLVPSFTPTPTVDPVGTPLRFLIPKIAVDAPIEAVGTDIDGKMLLPQELHKVGWYSQGFKPGQRGNAVIAGHLDSAAGTGAIFSELYILEPGDTMTIVDDKGVSYVFTVTAKEVYPFNEVPISDIFGTSEEVLLNLITCTGVWDFGTHNYSHRMIIRARLTSKIAPAN